MKESLSELHLFAGAGGGILGGMLLGHTCVCAVEIEPFCRKVLFQRQRDGILPKFPVWDDVETFDGNPWRGLVDVVCGGFPCQDISAAGKGAGIRGERSGLWSEFARIICEVQPRYVFVENSPMLIVRGIDVVLGDLATLGYDARWGVFSAADVGARHRRERLWIFAYASGIRCENNEGIHFDISIQKLQTQSCNSNSSLGSLQPIKPREPAFTYRADDGLTEWMDRSKAIGNGQVPAVAALAWVLLGGTICRP